MNNKYIGIDNGLNGAICVLQDNKLIDILVMPILQSGTGRNEYDVYLIMSFLKKHVDAIVILEKAQYTPMMGGIAVFSFAKNYGIMIGLLTALNMQYHIVHAKTWQGKLFKDQSHDDTKQASAIVAQRLFPGIDFRATDRSKKLHDGKTDAALLSYFGAHYLFDK